MKLICQYCNKEFASYASRCNHIKKFHVAKSEISSKIPTIVTQNHSNNEIKSEKSKIICEFCNKSFSRKDNVKRHQLKCEKKENVLLLVKKLENEVNILKSKTINKKVLTNTNNTLTNNNSHNKTTINGNVNQYYIAPTGKEDTQFTISEIKEIFKDGFSMCNKQIELKNLNPKREENHSFCAINRDGGNILTCNTDDNNIKHERKKYFLEEVISNSIKDTEILYLKNKNLFNKNDQKRIEENIESLKEHYIEGRKSSIYRELIHDLNLRIYNNRGIILKTWEKVFGKDLLKKMKIYCSEITRETTDIQNIFILPEEDDSVEDTENTDVLFRKEFDKKITKKTKKTIVV